MNGSVPEATAVRRPEDKAPRLISITSWPRYQTTLPLLLLSAEAFHGGSLAGSGADLISAPYNTNELMIPDYKNVWANVRRIGRAPEADAMSFKDIEYPKDI